MNTADGLDNVLEKDMAAGDSMLYKKNEWIHLQRKEVENPSKRRKLHNGMK